MSKQDGTTTGGSYLCGVLLLLLAALLWSLNGALIKLINAEGAGPNAVTIAFSRSLVAGLFLLPLARGKLHTLRHPSGSREWLGLRPAAVCCTVFFALMSVAFVVANTQTEAANAIILQYTSTFWVFGLSPWLLKERPRRRDSWILMLAVAGIAIIFLGNADTDLFGLVVGLGAGVFFALLTIMIRRLRDADSAAVVVLNNLGSAALILPLVVIMGAGPMSTRSVVLLAIMGVVQFGLPYYFYSRGLVRVPAYQAALITMAEPILVPVWTYLAVGERVPVSTLSGGSVILLALALFVWTAGRGGGAPDVERVTGTDG